MTVRCSMPRPSRTDCNSFILLSIFLSSNMKGKIIKLHITAYCIQFLSHVLFFFLYFYLCCLKPFKTFKKFKTFSVNTIFFCLVEWVSFRKIRHTTKQKKFYFKKCHINLQTSYLFEIRKNVLSNKSMV